MYEELTVKELWDVNTRQMRGSYPEDAKASGAALMERTDRSAAAKHKANLRQAQRREEMRREAERLYGK